jgi:hypothetical protein
MSHRRVRGWMRRGAAALLLPALLVAGAPGVSRAPQWPSRIVLPGPTVVPEGMGY